MARDFQQIVWAFFARAIWKDDIQNQSPISSHVICLVTKCMLRLWIAVATTSLKCEYTWIRVWSVLRSQLTRNESNNKERRGSQFRCTRSVSRHKFSFIYFIYSWLKWYRTRRSIRTELCCVYVTRYGVITANSDLHCLQGVCAKERKGEKQ